MLSKRRVNYYLSIFENMENYMLEITVDFSKVTVYGQIKNIQSTLLISNSKGLTEILRDIRTSTYQS